MAPWYEFGPLARKMTLMNADGKDINPISIFHGAGMDNSVAPKSANYSPASASWERRHPGGGVKGGAAHPGAVETRSQALPGTRSLTLGLALLESVHRFLGTSSVET